MILSRHECIKCSLCNNPGPLMDTSAYADIMIVGLSAKIAKYENEIPLDGRTRSGRIIDEFEGIAKENGLTIYRTNIVKCAPLDEKKKLRYPKNAEIEVCFSSFEEEIRTISPKTIVLLGDIVRKAVMKKWGLDIKKPEEQWVHITKFDEKYIIAMYHPSYILRSKERRQNYNKLLKQVVVCTKERYDYGSAVEKFF